MTLSLEPATLMTAASLSFREIAVTRYWIVDIRCSEAVERKIEVKHGVTLAEVWEATALGNYLEARFDNDDEHGSRLLVKGYTRGGSLLFVVLQPLDRWEGTWTLRTARRLR